MRKLNLGSGQRKFGAPWINVDSQRKWEPDVVDDAGHYLGMFRDGEGVEMICLHHVLEHYGCGEADSLLRECRRVLVPGGSLLVFVPDLTELVNAWWKGRIDTQIFLTNLYGAYMGDEADRHRWGMTHQTLKATLKLAGFQNVQDFDWRKIPGADIAEDWWILGMEATR